MRASITFALAASTALGWIAPAMAQSADDGLSAGDIVVTARRVEERLQDVPISMTVFNQEQVAARNIVSGNDLATYTPSLSANSRFGAETAAFAIRGFTQENFTSPSVATYFADVIGPRANGGTAGGNGAGVGQFFDLQNVQVLKGPQGTLFGRNTTGGAVLIVPQKPTDQLGGYIEGSIGNFDMYRLQGVLNVPLADTLRIRLGFERQKRDGYINNKSGIGPKDYDDVDYWAFRAAIVADLTPDLENYLIARYSESKTNGTWNKIVAVNATGCDAGVDRSRYPLPASPQLNLPGEARANTASFLAPLGCEIQQRQEARGDGFWDVEAGNANPFLRIKQWGLTNTTTWRVNDNVTLKNIASYQQFRQSQSLFIGNDNFVFPASPNPTWTGLPFTWVGLHPADGLANVEQETITEELQIQGQSSDGRLQYVLGGYYEKANPLSPFQGTYSQISYVNYINAADVGVPAPPGSVLPFLATLSCSDLSTLQCTPINTFGSPQIPSLLQNSLTRYWYENIGFFGQATYKLTDQLAITGGIRYTIDKTRAEGGTRQLFFFAPNQYNAVCAVDNTIPASSGEDCITRARQTTKRPTWLINLDYKPTEDIMLYAKYARGYRQGNINASNTIPQGWGPEKVDSYEIGAKASFRGDLSGYFNFAAFYNDFTDQQLATSLIPNTPNASPAQAIVNAGKSRIQGIEVDALASYSAFSLAVGYTYLDTKLQSFTPVNFPGYLPAEPNSVVGGPLPLSPKHKLSITPTIRLPLDESVGDIRLSATYVHTSSQVTASPLVTPFGTVPAFDLLNLNLAWNSVAGSPIDLAAFVTNVTNEKYYTFAGGGWQSTGIEYAALGMPRMYGLRLKFRFGDFGN